MAEKLKTRSHGLSALPQYRHSRISTEMLEPVYSGKFIVDIVPPAYAGFSTEEKNLLLEAITKVNVGSPHKMPGAEVQHFMNTTRSYAGAHAGETHIDIDIDFEVNTIDINGQPNHLTYGLVRRLMDSVYNVYTGATTTKVNYAIPLFSVVALDRANRPYWGYICRDIFAISAVNPPVFDYSQKGIWKLSGVKFRCDSYSEIGKFAKLG